MSDPSPPAAATSPAPARREPPPPEGNPYPWYAPRFWHGMRCGDWLRLMTAGGWRIPPSRWMLAGPLLAIAPANSLLAAVQRLVWGRRIARTVIDPPPVFVVGHFRSGTTYLYELLARDPALAAPTAFDCFAATHFVLTRRIVPRWLARLAPAQRPMDRMAFGFDRPQEDEFALLAAGAPTIYRRLAFPRQPTPDLATLDGGGMSPRDERRLRTALRRFLQAQTLVHQQRLVVKSPVHTGRLALLAEWFPGAKFVHITRNPTTMFPSLQHAWRTLELTQGFQLPAAEADRDAMIADVFGRMYAGFRRDAAQLSAGQLCEVRYEDLAADPLSQLQRIYEELSLPGWDAAAPLVRAHAEATADHRVNAFADAELPAEYQAAVAWYRDRYGYAGG